MHRLSFLKAQSAQSLLNFDLSKSRRFENFNNFSVSSLSQNGLVFSSLLGFKMAKKQKKYKLFPVVTTLPYYSPTVVEHKMVPFGLSEKLSLSASQFSSKHLNRSIARSFQRTLEAGARFYFSELELVGLGYRLTLRNSTVRFRLGFSHVIILVIPSNVWLLKRKKKVLIYSTDKQSLTAFVSRLLKLKRMSVYKVKGLKLKNQIFNLKPGKKRAK